MLAGTSPDHEWRNMVLTANCEKCGAPILSGEDLCPLCILVRKSGQESELTGSVYSFSIVHRGVSERFKSKIPYVLALVHVEGGGRLLSNIVDSPVDQIKIGARVRAILGEDPEGRPLVQFILSEVRE
jgi:uncharacterized protein